MDRLLHPEWSLRWVPKIPRSQSSPHRTLDPMNRPMDERLKEGLSRFSGLFRSSS
jgi:hypothetical protein